MLLLYSVVSQRWQRYKFYLECAKLAKGGSDVGVWWCLGGKC